MSFTLWAEPVLAPNTAADSPTSPAVHSSLMHVEYCDIFQSSQSMNSGSSLAFRCTDDLATRTESVLVFVRGPPSSGRLYGVRPIWKPEACRREFSASLRRSIATKIALSCGNTPGNEQNILGFG